MPKAAHRASGWVVGRMLTRLRASRAGSLSGSGPASASGARAARWTFQRRAYTPSRRLQRAEEGLSQRGAAEGLAAAEGLVTAHLPRR